MRQRNTMDKVQEFVKEGYLLWFQLIPLKSINHWQEYILTVVQAISLSKDHEDHIAQNVSKDDCIKDEKLESIKGFTACGTVYLLGRQIIMEEV